MRSILKMYQEKTSLPRQGPFLDERKEGKSKSRPLPRPGKMTEYMIYLENIPRFEHTYSMYPQKYTTLPPPTPREDVIRGEGEVYFEGVCVRRERFVDC